MSLASSLVAKVKALFRRGKPVTADPATATSLRDAVATTGNADAATLAARLAAKEITATQFQEELYLLTRRSMIGQYALGRGGLGALTDADRATLSKLIGEQAGYLREFVGEIGTGNLTADAIAQRAAMYPESAIGAFTRGQMAAAGLEPPDYPPKHPQCRCALRTVEDETGPAVYWELQPDACPICVGVAATMDPWRPN